jgi:short/branched chain acyl-CoA dehydrogenase
VDPAISNICLTQNNVVNTALLNYGTTKQKEEYLPKLTTEYLGSFCVAEKGNTTLDSPNFAFATKAVF